MLRLGPVTVRWYGLMCAVGMAPALWVTLPVAAQRGTPGDASYAIFWGGTIASLAGGRLYFVVQNNPVAHVTHPTRSLAIWEGGMAFYSTIVLGVPVL